MNYDARAGLPPNEAVEISFTGTYAGQDSQYLILNGPNLNMLGKREPEIYGTVTLVQIVKQLQAKAAELGVSIFTAQSNYEGEILNLIHSAYGYIKGIIINPGAWGHTSLALADALSIIQVPVVEVHISNVYARETFRHHSYISAISAGVISGLGDYGYIAALEYIVSITC